METSDSVSSVLHHDDGFVVSDVEGRGLVRDVSGDV